MSVKLSSPNLSTLPRNFTSYAVGLKVWFEIYRTIFSKLTSSELEKEIDRAIEKPVFVERIGNNTLFLNNLLLLSAIVAQHSFTQHQHLKSLTILTLANENLDIGMVFYETIELIERQKKLLKKYHLELCEKMADALTTKQCQTLFDCNKLTQERFLQLIHSSSTTAHRNKLRA